MVVKKVGIRTVCALVSLFGLVSCNQISDGQKQSATNATSNASTEARLASAPARSAVRNIPISRAGLSPTSKEISVQSVLTSSRLSNQQNDPTLVPSIVPSSFEQEKWNNRIRLFDSNQTGVFTSNFGWRRLNDRANFHNGVDIWVKPGTEVLAPVSGDVVLSKSAGKQSEIVVRNGEILYTLLHVEPGAGVMVGQRLSKGQIAGKQSSYNHFEYAAYLVPSADPSKRGRDNAINPFALHEQPHLVN